MSDRQGTHEAAPRIQSVAELLAHAHALESDAAERYSSLAGQMETHNNAELATLFRKMAAIEAKHIARVEQIADNCELPPMAAWDYQWSDAEGPETTAFSQAHYQMTGHHALSQMLANETRAVAFFEGVAGATDDKDVRAMAAELAEEERGHVALINDWLKRYPPPPAGWDNDPDEPTEQD